MRCLVTGGAGFIGSHLVGALLAQGHSVRVLDDFSTGSRGRLSGLACDILEGNVCVPVTAGRAAQNIDWVFHLAAQASVIRSIDSPLETYRTNTLGTVTLLEAARAAGAKRFVLASTCAVYGDAKPPLAEDTLPRPMSPYAASKLAAEAAVSVANTGSFGTASLRLFNVYGPGQSPDGAYAAVVPRFLNALKAGEQPVIYGDGGQTRDFVAVADVVSAFMLAAQSNATGVFNIGSGQAVSVSALLQAACAATGRAATAKLLPDRRGEIRHSVADIRRAKNALGWEPHISLSDGLAAAHIMIPNPL